MGRRGITFEDVARAAEMVATSGDNPTVARIRTELGDTGSNYTISKYFNEWKHGRFNQSGGSSLKEDLPDPLQQAVTGLWGKLLTELQTKNEEIQLQAERLVKAIEAEKEQLAVELQLTQEELNRANLKTNHLQADLQSAHSALIEAKKNMAVLDERGKRSEELLVKLETETKGRLSEFERLYQESNTALKGQLQKSHQDLNECKEQLENQRHQYMLQLDQYRTAKEKSENQLIKIQTELKQKSASEQEKVEQIRALNVDLKVLQQQNLELDRSERELDKQVLNLQSELAANSSLLKVKEDRIQELKVMVDTLQKHLNRKNNRSGKVHAQQ